MEWLSIGFMILKAIGIVEDLYKGITGKGSVKKASVMALAQEVVSDMTVVSTGGQKETWENIQPFVSAFVDTAVSISNSVAPGTVTDEAFEKSKTGMQP
jgi:hypothetical protein